MSQAQRDEPQQGGQRIPPSQNTDRPALPADGRAAITCRKTGTEPSNCDILELVRGDKVYLGGKFLLAGIGLRELEVPNLDSLGQLQEIRAALLARRSRSTGASRVCETLHNVTCHLSQESDLIKTRQAYAGALGTLQLLFFITYLIMKIIIFVVKTVRKHNAKRHEEELELMESCLASRKAKSRAEARPRTGEKGSPPPAPTQL